MNTIMRDHYFYLIIFFILKKMTAFCFPILSHLKESVVVGLNLPIEVL